LDPYYPLDGPDVVCYHAEMESPTDRLMVAAKANDPNGVRSAIDGGADIHANMDFALCHTAFRGYVDVVRLLLAAGADVHAKDDGPLQLAAIGGHAEVVRLSLAAGANVHASGDAALYLSARNGHTQIARCLLTAGADPLVAWTHAKHTAWEAKVAAVMDDCADAMAPAQRTALAKKSELFVHMRATHTAARQHERLRR